MGRTFQTLTKFDIIQINRRMIQQFGGIFFSGNENLINPGSLGYLLEMIDGLSLDHDPYPTIFEKSGVLAWRIITGHYFVDGNKRTGMEACRLFLELNNYQLRIDQEVVHIALRIAKKEIEFNQFIDWLKANITMIN